MEEELLLWEENGEGRPIGRISCARQGMYVRFVAGCPRQGDRGGVRKVWLQQGEKRMLLGTLLPEGNRLTLRRSVSLSALAEQGVPSPERGIVTGGEPCSRPGGGQWQGPERFPLPLPEGGCPQRRWGWKPEGDGFLLRFPWGVGQPWPMVSLFCFGQVAEGAVLYHLDSRGVPRMPEASGG